jgi:membrane fusion protein (multidrug efflux system)
MRQFLVAAGFGLMAVATVSTARAQGPGGAPPPPEVSFVTTAVESVPLTADFVGVTQASRHVEVRARVKGFLDKRLFTEGSIVKEGDLLYTIDPRQFAADVKVVEARLDQAKAGVASALAGRDESKASLELNTREYERYLGLRTSGAVSQGDLDRVQKELDTAKAKAASAEAAVSQAEATLRLAQAELENAQLELSYTQIHAALTGVIGKTLKEPGSLVDDGDSGKLTEITQLSPIYVSVNISEPQYLAWKAKDESGEIMLKPGAKESLQVVLQNGSVFPEMGWVSYESPAFDMTTGTFEVRGEFANTESILRPGQFVKVKLNGWERPGTISVPQRSVNQMPSGPYVYVIDAENKITFRPVVLGQWTGSQWVIESGLQAGERVLVEGFMKVRPGAVVNPVPYEATPVAAANPAAAGKE